MVGGVQTLGNLIYVPFYNQANVIEFPAIAGKNTCFADLNIRWAGHRSVSGVGN